MTVAQKKPKTFTVSMEPKWVDVLPIYLEALNKPSTYTDALGELVRMAELADAYRAIAKAGA